MKKYLPLGLVSDTMKSFFNQTLATRQSKNVIKCVLFQRKSGFQDDSKPLYFDEDLLEHIKPALEFMMGQLKDVHEHKKSITPQSLIKRYDDVIWVDNQNDILRFLHLACAAGLIYPIDAKTSSLTFCKEIYPTIDVLDPNFRDWEKEHKPKILKLIEEENK